MATLGEQVREAITRSARPQGMRPLGELAHGRAHGDRLRYMAGCRCVECRRSNTQYEIQRAAARKAGDWNGFVPAAPARAHIAALSLQGIGKRQVVDAAGVSNGVVGKIINGDRAKIRARTAKAILAVTPAAAADHSLVDAAPTWALLDDLLATGYTKATLALELGAETPALQIRRTQCLVRTAYAVQQLHARLRRVPAKPTLALIAELCEEGYRHRIQDMLDQRAIAAGVDVPDLTVHGGFIHAGAAEQLRRLHAELTGEGAFDPD